MHGCAIEMIMDLPATSGTACIWIRKNNNAIDTAKQPRNGRVAHLVLKLRSTCHCDALSENNCARVSHLVDSRATQKLSISHANKEKLTQFV